MKSPAHGTENSHCGLWSFVTLQQFLEVALPATAGNTYLALCLGPSGPRACALSWPAVLRDPAALLHPHIGTRNRPMPWTECPLFFTFFISVSLASHLEGVLPKLWGFFLKEEKWVYGQEGQRIKHILNKVSTLKNPDINIF